MMHNIYFCRDCKSYMIIPPPHERCICMSLDIKLEGCIPESEVENKIEELRKAGKRVI